MTRFARTRRVGRWFTRHPVLIAYLLIGLVVAGGVNELDNQADQRSRDQAVQANERCEDNRDNRAVIRELVEVATAPSSAGGGDLSALTQLPSFQRLDQNDKEFWIDVFQALSVPSDPSDGRDPPSSTNQRLIDFAKSRLTPIDCGT